MITLVLIVCLNLSDPSSCREEYPFDDVASGLSCLVQGQQIAAQWTGDHPKWSLKGWECRKVRPAGKA